MRWSKVKALVEDSFADSVKNRVRIHSTGWRANPLARRSYGTAWIDVDGERIASFDDTAVWTMRGDHVPDDLCPSAEGIGAEIWKSHEGRYYAREFRAACWQYLHSSVTSSLEGPSAIVRALALLNSKVGRARLARYVEQEAHPLAKQLGEFRLSAEASAKKGSGSKASALSR
jgi:hypothetical protein